jgi:hypothetical protein
MIWYKSCFRCERGDVVEGKDMWSPYIICLQCGYLKDLDVPRRARVSVEDRSKEMEQAALPPDPPDRATAL